MSGKRKRRRPGRDTTDQYIGLSYVMIRGPAWRSLSGPAVKVWLELRTRYAGFNNGKLILSLDEGARLLGLGKATVLRAFAELQEKGFVKLTRRGQWYGRLASEWAVTDRSLNGHLATRDWQRWQPPNRKNSRVRFPNGPIGVPDESATEPSK